MTHVEILPILSPSPNGRKRVLFRAQCECGFLSGHHLSIREATFAGRYHASEKHGFDQPIIVNAQEIPEQENDDDLLLDFDDDDDDDDMPGALEQPAAVPAAVTATTVSDSTLLIAAQQGRMAL